MRKGKLTLTLLAIMSLVVISSSGAYASLYSGAWTVTGAEGVLSSSSLTVFNDAAQGNAFSIYGWQSGESMQLVAPYATTKIIRAKPVTSYTGTSSDVFIYEDGGQYKAEFFDGTKSINLGANALFGFSFANSSGTPDFTYDLAQLSDNNSWLLRNDMTGMTVSVQGDVAPTHTPLPGAALLFGSSLLGLLGIGNRKNKA